jgi:4-carboxymuconolactone decarboxylase
VTGAAESARPGLPPGDRALISIAIAAARGDTAALAAELARARDSAVARDAVEETLLQIALFAGFPRCISAFELLARQWPAATPPAGGGLPPAQQPAAGRALFDRIYGRNADAVRAMLAGHHQELHDFVLDCAYGRILTRGGLAPRQRELIAVAVLALQQQWPQLVAHARGARAFGAGDAALRETLWGVLRDDAQVGDCLRRIGPAAP